MQPMRIWWKNYMLMQLLKGKNSSVGFMEKHSLWPLPIWQKFFTSTGWCWGIHQYMMICIRKKIYSEALGKDLEFSPNGNSINVSSLSPELRVLIIIMFQYLYPLSSTGYMNLRRALFLHDLISDVEIDICAHIFHILCKTVMRTDSRICIPFCCLVSRILKLKGIYPSGDESSHPKPSPINL